MEFFHDIISSPNRIATRDRNNVVRIYGLDSLQKIASFSVDADSGESRLAMAPNGQLFAAGRYDSGRLVLHRLDGTMIWEREALYEMDAVYFSLDSETVFCAHRGVVSAFNTKNGQLSRFGRYPKRLIGLRRFYESPYDNLSVHDRIASPLQFAANTFDRVCEIDRKSFGVIDIAFAPELVCISEAAAPISCYHVNGAAAWEVSHKEGVHALRLVYREEQNRFLAITWPFQNGGAQSLVTIEPTSGSIVQCRVFATEYTHYFAGNGVYLINRAGDVLTSADLELVGQLQW